LKAIGVRALGLCERLEPIRDFLEPLTARGFRHARIHVGVFVGLAGDGGLQVVARLADRKPRRRIADGLEILEVPVRVARFTLGRRAEHRCDVVVAFDVGLGGEIQITAVRLRFAGKGVLQVLLGRAALEFHRSLRKNRILGAEWTSGGRPLDFV
jgi:hypothetical protein